MPRTVQWQTGKKITPETRIKREIKQGLSYTGWFCFHVLQGMGAHKGIPDMIATKKGITLFIEVKSPKGKQSPHQVEFQRQIEGVGGNYIVARNFDDVYTVIQRITGQTGKERLF